MGKRRELSPPALSAKSTRFEMPKSTPKLVLPMIAEMAIPVQAGIEKPKKPKGKTKPPNPDSKFRLEFKEYDADRDDKISKNRAENWCRLQSFVAKYKRFPAQRTSLGQWLKRMRAGRAYDPEKAKPKPGEPEKKNGGRGGRCNWTEEDTKHAELLAIPW